MQGNLLKGNHWWCIYYYFSHYSKGQCTWGASCRFVHPGVLDKGNYNMFAPPRPILPTEQEPIEKVNNLKKYNLLFIDPFYASLKCWGKYSYKDSIILPWCLEKSSNSSQISFFYYDLGSIEYEN